MRSVEPSFLSYCPDLLITEGRVSQIFVSLSVKIKLYDRREFKVIREAKELGISAIGCKYSIGECCIW